MSVFLKQVLNSMKSINKLLLGLLVLTLIIRALILHQIISNDPILNNTSTIITFLIMIPGIL